MNSPAGAQIGQINAGPDITQIGPLRVAAWLRLLERVLGQGVRTMPGFRETPWFQRFKVGVSNSSLFGRGIADTRRYSQQRSVYHTASSSQV